MRTAIERGVTVRLANGGWAWPVARLGVGLALLWPAGGLRLAAWAVGRIRFEERLPGERRWRPVAPAPAARLALPPAVAPRGVRAPAGEEPSC